MNDFVKSITEFNNNVKGIGNGIKTVWYYTTHLQSLALLIWNCTVKYSFWICLLICLGGTILYIIGIKKGSKWAKISFFSYLAIQVFNTVSR